jgi:hypothetical protein
MSYRDRTRSDAAKARSRTRRSERRRKSALLFLTILSPRDAFAADRQF